VIAAPWADRNDLINTATTATLATTGGDMNGNKDRRVFLTVPEAAKLCGVDRTTFFRWCKAGKVRAVQPVRGSTFRVPRAELDRILKDLGLSSSEGVFFDTADPAV